MANFTGTGAFKDVNLIAVTYPNSVTKNGKAQYIDVHLDARDHRAPGQTNLHLVSERVKDKDGNPRINNGAPYTAAQFAAIKEAAGANCTVLPNGAEVYGVKADVMPSSRRTGMVLNTTTLRASDHVVDATVLDRQFASIREAAKAKAEAAKAAEAEAQTAAPQAEAAEVTADEPALA
jgi:hypothetical protein